MKYTVTRRVFNEGKLVGYYMLPVEGGKEVKISLKATAKLCNNGDVVNATLYKNGDNYALRGKGIKLSELPVVDLKKAIKDDSNIAGNRVDINKLPDKHGDWDVAKKISKRNNVKVGDSSDAVSVSSELDNLQNMKISIEGLEGMVSDLRELTDEPIEMEY